MQLQNPYARAYQIAIKELSRRDLSEVAFNSSVQLEGEVLIVPALGQTYRIEERGKKIIQISDGREPKTPMKIILLHYLTTADGTTLKGNDFSFENIPGAGFYYPTFKARTISQLISAFQNDLTRFIKVGLQFNGRLLEGKPDDMNLNKVQIKIFVLPNVPVSFIYWRGQEELPPALQILFDASITHYLPLEDIVIVTEMLTYQLIRSRPV